MRKFILPMLVLLILFVAVTPASAEDSLRVYYAGPEGAVKTALELAKFTFVTDPTQADVLILNGTIPDPGTVAAQIDRGAGLVLILGPDLSADSVSTATGVPVMVIAHEDAVSLIEIKGLDDPLVKSIIWNGAPQVRERSETLTPLSSVQPLVNTYENDEWILWQARPNIYIFNAYLTNGFNPQIQEWAYFNYLIYHLVERAAGRTPLSFADYPASPVPHAAQTTVLFVLMGLMIVTTFGAFYFVRRYSKKHPEELDKIVSDRNRFQVQEEGTDWENVGFHRPLSGFLVALSVGLIMFIPLIIYQNLILPSYILPSAQALGIWAG